MGGAMETVDGHRGLSDLPEEALYNIIRQLDACQLAGLLVQDRRLRALASDGALWQALARARWPGCSAAHYGGDWRLLYRRRAALPSEFVREADRCHAATDRASAAVVRLNSATLLRHGGGGGGGGGAGEAGSAGASSGGGGAPAAGGAQGTHPALGSPSKSNVYGMPSVPYCNMVGMLLEEVMRAAFTLGLAAAAAGLRGGLGSSAGLGDGGGSGRGSSGAPPCAELARFRADIAWWMANRPEALVRFVRRAADGLREYDMWGGGFSAWPDVPWRRSALQFVLELPLGPTAGVCVSVTDRLQREATQLDAAIRGLRGEACHLDVRRPACVPRSHWWYFLAEGLEH